MWEIWSSALLIQVKMQQVVLSLTSVLFEVQMKPHHLFALEMQLVVLPLSAGLFEVQTKPCHFLQVWT